MKKLFFLMTLLAAPYTFCVNWKFWQKKAQPASATKPTPAMPIDDINKLINENARLKKQLASLGGAKVADTLKEIDQNVDYHKVADTLKNIDAIDNEKDSKIEELEKQVEHLGMSFFNTLKTFEANINSKVFSDTLKKQQATLDTRESAKLVNEAMANALYRLKFMYTEARYLLDWTNGKINWKTAEAKGIKPPVLKNNFSDDQIKNMVMAVKVD